jgi:hypothetical protein
MTTPPNVGDLPPVCADCGGAKELNGTGRCADCQTLFDQMETDLGAGETDLDTIVAQIAAASTSDDVFAALTKAHPPAEKLDQQRWREALLRAMKGKVSSPAKIVDAWIGSGDDDNQVGLRQAGELVQLVLARNAVLFHTPDRQAYAAVIIDGHREVMALRSRAFRQWLGRAYWEHTAPTTPAEDGGIALLALFAAADRVPTAQAVADATATLEGLAVFDGEEIPVHVRVAHFGNEVYLDLGNDKWEAVQVDADGWRIVPTPPVMFRRPHGLVALPQPAPGGTIDALRGFLNVADVHWPLVAGYAVALLSAGPYAVLVLLGEQGAGKSTAARVIRQLVDPNSSPLRNKPRSDHDLAIAAANAWVVSFDNLSGLPEWLSNTLCTIATGGGFSTRMLYTDDEERIFDARRPVILNGIGDIVARSDLLDRALLVPLPAIDAKESEEAFWARFDKAWPQLLGAVLNATAAAIAGVGDVELDETPRMVDFTRWATAAEITMGLGAGAVLEAYLANRATADQTALEASPIGRFVEQVVAATAVWEGSASELLNEINRLADTADKVFDDRVGPTRRQKEWPKAANALSNRLKLLAPNLRRVGVDVSIDRDETGSRITISRTNRL